MAANSEKFGPIVHAATNALRSLLAGSASDNNCKIQVHHFGTNLLYLPVYLLLKDIENCWNEAQNKGQPKLIIEYQNFMTDKSVCEAVTTGESWHANESAVSTLAIGISELYVPPKEMTLRDNYIEFPFIKRLPLWGVALDNNPKINLLKRRPVFDECSDLADDWRSREIRHEYWEAFRGKLSLLAPSDLVDEQLKFRISLYKSDTTAYRLFAEDSPNGLEGFTLKSEVTFDNEFDDLFHGNVDVALTVQPWLAVRRANSMGSRLETVYVHQGRPAPFSSVYCKRPSDDCYAEDVLRDLFEILYFGVREKIADIYELDGGKMADWLEILQEVEKKANAKADNLRQPETKTELRDFEVDDMRCAQHLITDSRIYYYEMSNLDRSEKLNLLTSKFREDFDLLRLSKIDPIATVTRLIARIPDIKRHGNKNISEIQKSSGNEIKQIESIISMAYKAAKSKRKFSFMKKLTGKEVCANWRHTPLTLKDVLPDLLKSIANHKILSEVNWKNDGNEYNVWFSKDLLKTALHFFNHQATKDGDSKLTFVDGDSGLLTNSVESGYAWVWIKYLLAIDAVSNPKEVPIFFSEESNRLGHLILHGWHVPPKGDPSLKFNLKHDLSFTKVSKGRLLLKKGTQEQYLDIKENEHGLLFTFNVCKK